MVTHFIGTIPPEELSELLTRCKAWMRDRYGCRSGFYTPIHVTLIPPFTLTDEELIQNLQQVLFEFAKNADPLTAQVKGVGAFAERTVFARVVPNQQWSELRDDLFSAVSKTLPGVLKKDVRTFTPHLTIANRDIPINAIPEALQYFSTLEIEKTFQVDNIALFERHSGVWEIETGIPLTKSSSVSPLDR